MIKYIFKPTCLFACIISLLSCADPNVDDLSSDPTGVIEGSVVYVGRKPDCHYENGDPTEVKGRIVLTLIDDDHALWPEGDEASPIDTLIVDGSEIFTDLNDCLSETPSMIELSQTITRSVNFRWTNIPLSDDMFGGVDYRIIGFYDQEGDYSPALQIAQSPTAGDVWGAYYQDATDSDSDFEIIEMGSKNEYPLGELRSGITVTLQKEILTDPPLFFVSDGDISSEGTFLGSMSAISMTLSLYSRDSTDESRVSLDILLDQIGFENLIDFEDEDGYAWYVSSQDLDRNEESDIYPFDIDDQTIIPFLSPYVYLERIQNEIEVMVGLPSVSLIPFQGEESPQATYYPDLILSVPTVAAMVLNLEALDECTVFIAPDGSWAELYEDNISECHELPTGIYQVYVDSAIDGINQSWEIPNELGDCTELGGQRDCEDKEESVELSPLASQGRLGAVVIHDPDILNAAGRRESKGDTLVCDEGPSAEGSTVAYSFNDYFDDEIELCCTPIEHLCDVPLCDYETVTPTWSGGTSYQVRGQPDSVQSVNGTLVPNCMPFALPSQCCSDDI